MSNIYNFKIVKSFTSFKSHTSEIIELIINNKTYIKYVIKNKYYKKVYLLNEAISGYMLRIINNFLINNNIFVQRLSGREYKQLLNNPILKNYKEFKRLDIGFKL